jgi:predicted nucleic acid-binding protein
LILVDSSVWIDFFRGIDNSGALRLREILRYEEMVVGDLIVVEVLQGYTNEREAEKASELLGRFEQVSIVDPLIARQAATHYRRLRRQGITIRKTIDLLIATRCLDKDWSLLHNDRDFEPLCRYLGLRTLPH